MTRSSILFATLLTPIVAFSQQADTVQLKAFEVRSTRVNTSLHDASRHIQLLDSTSLQHAPALQISELLRANTSIDVRQRSAFDVQTDIGIRGGTFDQSLILIDGIPMNDPQTGHHTMNLGLLGSSLQQVEVLYGAAARTYGAGAYSGSINLIPALPTNNTGSLSVEGAEFGTFQVQASQSFYKNGKGIRVNAQHRSSDGFVANTDHDLSGANVLAYLPINKAVLKVQGIYDHKRFGALNFYTSAFPNQQEETEMFLGAFDLAKKGTYNWKLRGYMRQNSDRFELFRESEDYYSFTNGLYIHQNGDTAPSWYTFHNQHRTRVLGGEFTVDRKWKGGTSAFGIHVRSEEIKSNVLGEVTWDPSEHVGETAPTYTHRDSRNNIALHLDHKFTKGKFTADAGVLVNLNTEYDTELLPGLDLVFALNEQQRLFANVGRGFRLPTFTDLYYNRGGAQGSIDLQPEHNTQFEFGHRLTSERFTQTIALFHRSGTDLIDWVLLPGDSVVRAQNITSLGISGVELSGSWNSEDERSLLGLSYSYISNDRDDFDFTSLYVLDQLTHRLSARAQHRVGKLTVRANAVWQERAGSYVQFGTGEEVEYPSNLRIDARVAYSFKQLELFVSAYNLLDSEQIDRPNVLLPGRWLSGGLRVKW